MDSLNPLEYQKIKASFKNELELEDYFKELIYFTTIRVLVKAKYEEFNGLKRLKFYAQDVKRMEKSDKGAKVFNEKMIQAENKHLLNKLDRSKSASQE